MRREVVSWLFIAIKDQPYVPQSPEETESTKSSDYQSQVAVGNGNKMGSREVRFVIGKSEGSRQRQPHGSSGKDRTAG